MQGVASGERADLGPFSMKAQLSDESTSNAVHRALSTCSISREARAKGNDITFRRQLRQQNTQLRSCGSLSVGNPRVSSLEWKLTFHT